MSVVYFLNYVAGKSSCADAAAAEANGIKESEATVSSNLAIRRLCADGGGAAKQLLLPGATPEHRAEVDSWLDFATSFTPEHLGSVNRHLKGRSFLAGEVFSLADIVVYFACAPAVTAANAASAKNSLDLSRWFNHVQHRVKAMAPSCKVTPPTVPLNIFTPIPIPLPPKRNPTASPPPSTTAATTPGDAVAASPKSVPGMPGRGDQASGGGGSGKKDKDKNKSENKNKKDKEGGGDATATEAAASSSEGKGGGGKAGPGGGDKPAPAAPVDGDPSKLDVRVGVIVKAWEHPDSDKLYCEEIDLGEGKTRMIASGLRANYTLEEMQGRRVTVLANLKARNLGGFKSEGMVLCASSADHSVVKIIEPPPGAAIGARVTVSGTEGEPATPAQLQKKKIFEKCVPKLRTNSEGLPGYDGVGIFNVDGEPCVATIPEVHVS
eukprot:jgi/Undpi1/4634/HiC_scaffold_18.g07988.m1